MPPTCQLDHLVIIVNDLPRAAAAYRRLGFTVQPGGEHADGLSHNALITFADGSYLELFAVKKPLQRRLIRLLGAFGLLEAYTHGRSPIARRFMQSVAYGEGLADFALAVDDIDGAAADLNAQGIAVDGPAPGGRARPDGIELAWRLAIPRRRDLPFLIEDDTERHLRVPSGAVSQHPNGVTGVRGLSIAVSDLPASVAGYRALPGVPVRMEEHQAAARVGDATLHLTPGSLRSGPYHLTLLTGDAAQAGPRDTSETHNVAMTLLAT